MGVSTVEDQFEAVNRALERCFGSRGVVGWDVWVTGAQLGLLARDFRKEYVKLEEVKCPQLPILNGWIDDLLDKLKAM
jgi:hypothetical protein